MHLAFLSNLLVSKLFFVELTTFFLSTLICGFPVALHLMVQFSTTLLVCYC